MVCSVRGSILGVLVKVLPPAATGRIGDVRAVWILRSKPSNQLWRPTPDAWQYWPGSADRQPAPPCYGWPRTDGSPTSEPLKDPTERTGKQSPPRFSTALLIVPGHKRARAHARATNTGNFPFFSDAQPKDISEKIPTVSLLTEVLLCAF